MLRVSREVQALGEWSIYDAGHDARRGSQVGHVNERTIIFHRHNYRDRCGVGVVDAVLVEVGGV